MCIRPSHTYLSPMEKSAHLVGVNESHDNDVLPSYNEIIPESKETFDNEKKISFDCAYYDEKSIVDQLDNYDFSEDYELGEVYDLSNEDKVVFNEKEEKYFDKDVKKQRMNKKQRLIHSFTAIGSIVFLIYLFMLFSGKKCSMSQMKH